MTREDIERMTTAPDCFVPTPEVVRELARRALAQDRALRVGEAVIASGVTAEWCEKHLRDLHNAQGSMSLSSPAYGRAFTQEIALFSVLAEALRGEP